LFPAGICTKHCFQDEVHEPRRFAVSLLTLRCSPSSRLSVSDGKKCASRAEIRAAFPRSTVEFNPLTPKDPYSGRTAPPTSKRCILYIYSTNIGTQYFKHGIYSPFLSLQNAVCLINLMYLVPVLFTFYIQGVLKLKKNRAPKG